MGLGSEMKLQLHQQKKENGGGGKKNGRSSNNHYSDKKPSNSFADELKNVVAAVCDAGGKTPKNKKTPGKKQHLTPYPPYNNNAKSKPVEIPNNNYHHHQRHGSGGGQYNKGKQFRGSPVMKNAMLSPQPRPVPVKSSSPVPVPSPQKYLVGGKFFYAGAKFETNPTCMELPPPPTHWTGSGFPGQRSQSQPSTPVTVCDGPQFNINWKSLLGSPSPNKTVMAKSLPGNEMSKLEEAKKQMVESDSSDEELKEIMKEGIKKDVTDKKKEVPSPTAASASPRKPVNLMELKTALEMITSPRGNGGKSLDLSCQGSLRPLNDFKEMSDQLKSLMKVAA